MRLQDSFIGLSFLVAIISQDCHVFGNVTLPALFGDNMVLQQGENVAIWGKALPEEKVSVAIGAISGSAVTDANGRWQIKLPPLQLQTEPVDIVIQGQNRIVLKNVLIGDVWLGAGQSNMEFSVVRAKNGTAEVAEANHPKIRLFRIKKTAALQPADDVAGEWKVCDPNSVKDFSAVLYYFGRDLQERIHTPIGLMQAAWSGTRIQAWSPPEVIQVDTYSREQMADETRRLDDPEWIRAENERRMTKWNQDAEKAKSAGKPEPRKPLLTSPTDSNRHCVLYNGMIAPLTQLNIRGVVWYQGENNSGSPGLYQRLFPPMITSWRAAWQKPEMPFIFVQLPNWLSQGPKADPTDTLWTRMREVQTATLKLPYTGMAVTIDAGEPGDIHPLNKQTVGHRLMLAAMSTAYGDTNTTSPGPMFDDMTRENGNIRIRFKNAGEGLVLSDQRSLTGFTAAGADRVFHDVTGTVEKNSVVLDCSAIPNVQSVRYAWSDDPQANLYNKAGLPVVPFRTDQWPRQNSSQK